MKLSIITPTRDRQAIFEQSYRQTLAATEHLGSDIIIINNSPSRMVQLPEQPQRVKLLDNPRNKDSASSARNYGAENASGDILLFLDDDILISRAAIDGLLNLHRQYPGSAFNVNWEYPPALMDKINRTLFGRYLQRIGFTNMRGYYGEGWQANTLFPANGGLASFFFSISRADFNRIGGYDDATPHEGSDDLLNKQLKEHHIGRYVDTRLTVYHNEEDRTGMKGWLERRQRYGEAYLYSIQTGLTQEKSFPYYKRLAFGFLYTFRAPLMALAEYLSRTRRGEMIFYPLMNILQGAHIYAGYAAGRKKARR